MNMTPNGKSRFIWVVYVGLIVYFLLLANARNCLLLFEYPIVNHGIYLALLLANIHEITAVLHRCLVES